MLKSRTIFSLVAAFMAAAVLVPPADAAPKKDKPKAAKTEKASKKPKSDVPYENAVEVFVAGQGNPYASIRIPDVIKAGGMLVAAAEGRYNNADQGKNDIIVSVSKDGKKWSTPVVAAEAKGATFNNPCLTYDKETKQILLFFQRFAPNVKEQGGGPPPGWNDEKCLRCFVCMSKNGKTWTKPVDVTKYTKHEDASLTCSGPNPGIQLTRGEHKGRICIPFNEGKFGSWVLTCAYTDDHGKTWKIGEKSASGGGINEVSMVETDDGGLFVVSRAWPPQRTQRVVAYSSDGGETWGPITAHDELPSYNVQNGLTRYSHADEASKGNRSRILFSAPGVAGRKDGVVKMSYDNGKTWPVSKEVGSGPFGYSSITIVKPGTIGLLFEENSNCIKKIKFTTFTMSWLTDGEDTGKGKKPTDAPTSDSAAE